MIALRSRRLEDLVSHRSAGRLLHAGLVEHVAPIHFLTVDS